MRVGLLFGLCFCLLTSELTAADSGFRADPGGFSFRNYGNHDDILNLTPAEVIRMFGPGAAAGKDENGESYLTPPVQEWMEMCNEALAGGHCEGFAVLSYLFHLGVMKPTAFGAPSTFELALADNPALQREIAFWWATQLTETTRADRVRGTPCEILEHLRAGLVSKELAKAYTIAFFMPDWTRGHAVTPYAVEDVDSTQSRILIYDNNFPNQERFIEVDREANSWGYSTASNPGEGEFAYTGDATTNTLFLTPCEPRLGIHTADWLEEAEYSDDPGIEEPEEDSLEPGEDSMDDDEDLELEEDEDSAEEEASTTGAATAGRTMEICLSGSGARLLIVDENGKRLGTASGTFVNEIPGAEVVRIVGAGWTEIEPEPRYRLAEDREYEVRVIGQGGSSGGVSVTCLGRGTELEVSGISLEPGQVDRIRFAPDGSGIRYLPGGSEHPDLEIGFEGEKADYEILARGVETSPGAAVDLEILPELGCVQVQVFDSSEPATVELQIRRLGEQGIATFKNDDLVLKENDAAYFHFAAWDGESTPMEVDFDSGGDGVVDSEWKAVDEPGK